MKSIPKKEEEAQREREREKKKEEDSKQMKGERGKKKEEVNRSVCYVGPDIFGTVVFYQACVFHTKQ